MSQFTYKMVIVVRKDLDMRCGKIAVQVGHAVIESFKLSSESIRDYWMKEGGKKVVLKVNSEQELHNLQNIALTHGINSYIVVDFGLTQIEPNTKTAIALEIGTEETIDKITNGISLL